MIIAIIGPSSAGKATLAKYLINKGFIDMSPSPPQSPLSSSSLEYIQTTWSKNYVLILDHGNCCHIVLGLKKRPYFLLVAIDAPVLIRHSRQNRNLSLIDFLNIDQKILYTQTLGLHQELKLDQSLPTTCDQNPPPASLAALMHTAHINILNDKESIADLHLHFDALDILNMERLRPCWDTYFIRLSEWASMRSNCMKRRVGCIVVKDNQIISTGYNGTPRGLLNCNQGGCARCNMGTRCGERLYECLCLHAEENALLEAGRARIANGTLYCTTCPCLGCAKKIVQSGIARVVYLSDYGMDHLTISLFNQANIPLQKYISVLNHINILS